MSDDGAGWSFRLESDRAGAGDVPLEVVELLLRDLAARALLDHPGGDAARVLGQALDGLRQAGWTDDALAVASGLPLTALAASRAGTPLDEILNDRRRPVSDRSAPD